MSQINPTDNFTELDEAELAFADALDEAWELGRTYGYKQATEESYPELTQPTEV